METIDINSTWEKVLVLLKDKISEPTYSTWIVPLVPHCFNENEFCVLTAHNLSIQIINRSCHDTIVKVLSKEIGKNVTFRIIYSKELEEQQKKQAKKEKNEDFIKNLENKIVPSKYDGLKQMRSSCNLNLKYKFDNFVVGSNNNFAYHAAYLSFGKILYPLDRLSCYKDRRDSTKDSKGRLLAAHRQVL